MDPNDIMDNLAATQSRLLAAQPVRMRLAYDRWDLKACRATLILGPRGIGKTSLLLREAERHGNILYLSADHPYLDEVSLWTIAETAFLRGYDGVAIDEVHFARDWSRHLKAIYDSYPKKIIWASDSSSVVLRSSVGDLSRRFLQMRLSYLSLREYIHLKDGIELPTLNPFTAKPAEFSRILDATNVMAAFTSYTEEGFRPFFIEGNYADRLLAVLEKSIHADVPYFVPQIQENHLRLMRAVVSHLALAAIPTINIDGMCSEWSLGKEKLHQLLGVLEHLEIIRIIRFQKDRRRLSKGAKLFVADPTIYSVLGGNKGSRREAMVCTFLAMAGFNVTASDNETLCDFVANDVTLEVGGQSKKRKKADWVIRDDTDRPSGKSIPLWSLSML
ncbi:MAG: ATP-binding protein [Deltaproteobacteria bacterium]|nr:ATP-binding protein [Deltaproteobacteria bacterium]